MRTSVASISQKSVRAKPAYLVCMMMLFIQSIASTSCRDSISSSMNLRNISPLPCWFEICPGETHKQQAMTLLASNQHVIPDSIVDKSYNNELGSYIAWDFTSDIHDFGRIFYVDDLVTLVRIAPRPEGTLTFEDVITNFGEPGQVWAYSDCADSRWLYIGLIYPEKGVYVVHFDSSWQEDEPAILAAELPVFELIYFDPKGLESLMMVYEGANWLGYGYTFEDILERMQPWPGFTDVKVITDCY